MKYRKLIAVWFLTFFGFGTLHSQIDCALKSESVYLPKENQTINAKSLSTILKNNTTIILYKTDKGKYYLKLIVSENLYFNRVDILELKSGTKSIFFKDTKHYEIDKNTGYYSVEILKNYIATLKDEGLTAIKFGNAQTNYTKQDCKQIKQIAKCLYESIDISKTKQQN
jgi:hypothetical protein